VVVAAAARAPRIDAIALRGGLEGIAAARLIFG
jgi:hypothetical protein